MLSTIPTATDHISKFAALFGLVLMVSSILGLVYLYNRYEDRVYTYSIESEILKAEKNLSDDEQIRKSALDTRLQIDRSNKNVFTYLLSILGGIGALAALGGFTYWGSKVQPRQDELFNLQIEKMKLEIMDLQRKSQEK